MCDHYPRDKIPGSNSKLWRPDDIAQPTPPRPGSNELYRPDILQTIEKKIEQMDAELRELSLDIHAHPEIGYREYHAHDVYTTFMEGHGFEVTRHFHLETAWQATFSHGTGGRTIGINSEMDALEGIGHACGHNLIGMAGVAIACAIKAALEKHNISGNIVLLGTPAEEGGSGKVVLLEKSAYEGMDACLMCHPVPGPIGSVSLSSCLALERMVVEYGGQTAHAAISPWEGKNALDAAILAYNTISALRQQLKPTHRIHTIIEGKDWTPNTIPAYAKFICHQAAALATGCQFSIEHLWGSTFDLRQNRALGDDVANVVLNKYGAIDHEWGIQSASTDFGNISYAIPSLHPAFAIPTILHGGNHTTGFADAAATTKAHYACLDISKALAATGVRVLTDDKFFAEVVKTFKEDEAERGLP